VDEAAPDHQFGALDVRFEAQAAGRGSHISKGTEQWPVK
jgi:hypothetical protein